MHCDPLYSISWHENNIPWWQSAQSSLSVTCLSSNCRRVGAGHNIAVKQRIFGLMFAHKGFSEKIRVRKNDQRRMIRSCFRCLGTDVLHAGTVTSVFV